MNDQLAAAIERGKTEILDDVRRGVVPATVTRFSQLHDHVDANEYGGLTGEAVRRSFTSFEAWLDFGSDLHAALDDWLAAGGLGQRDLEDTWQTTTWFSDLASALQKRGLDAYVENTGGGVLAVYVGVSPTGTKATGDDPYVLLSPREAWDGEPGITVGVYGDEDATGEWPDGELRFAADVDEARALILDAVDVLVPKEGLMTHDPDRRGDDLAKITVAIQQCVKDWEEGRATSPDSSDFLREAEAIIGFELTEEERERAADALWEYTQNGVSDEQLADYTATLILNAHTARFGL